MQAELLLAISALAHEMMQGLEPPQRRLPAALARCPVLCLVMVHLLPALWSVSIRKTSSLLLDRTWFLHLFHEIIIPFSLYFYMSGCTKKYCLYQVVIEIDIQAWLSKLIQYSHGGTAFNGPCFEICGGFISEGAASPHKVSVPTNKMWAGVSIKPWQRTTLVRAWVNAILTGSLRACSPQYK